MQAVAVFPRTREVKTIEQAEPQIRQPDEVKVRMLEVGICGTDKEICSFQYGTPPQGSDYLVIGHESLGEVIDTGPAVSKLRSGDLVVMMVRRPCSSPTCYPCRAGSSDFCRTGDFTERGIREAHGFMTEYVVDQERYMHVVPPELRDVAVLVEPLTIAEKARAQLLQIVHRHPWVNPDAPAEVQAQRTLRAVVLGAGPVGLLGAMSLVAAGWQTFVYALAAAPNPASAIVEALGAMYISRVELTQEQYNDLLGNIDLIYEATGVSSLAFNAMKILGPNSVFVFTGVPARKPPKEIDTDLLMRDMVLKNQIILGTVNAGPEDFGAAIRDLGVFNSRWPDVTRSLITGYTSVDHAQDVLLGKAGGIKNVITFDKAATASKRVPAQP